MKQKIICFDVGGTNISRAVVEVDSKEKQFDFLDFETVKNPVKTELVKDIFLGYAKEQSSRRGTKLVAISTARPVDKKEMLVYGAQDYYGEKYFKFDFLKEAGFEIEIENDGKSFALGEYYFGQGRKEESILALVIGTGIGCGYVGKNGKVLNGKKGFATEVEHQQIFFEGAWRRWGEFCGGRGIEDQYLKKTGTRKDAQDIFRTIEKDNNAGAVIEQAKEFLGVGIANLLTVFDPDKVIIGGGVSNHKDFIEESFQIARQNLFFGEYVDYSWDFTKLNRKANLLGVSWKFFEEN
ncbi:MAG: ROK family protein [Candidatus Moraniibacteriota bacterium]